MICWGSNFLVFLLRQLHDEGDAVLYVLVAELGEDLDRDDIDKERELVLLEKVSGEEQNALLVERLGRVHVDDFLRLQLRFRDLRHAVHDEFGDGAEVDMLQIQQHLRDVLDVQLDSKSMAFNP